MCFSIYTFKQLSVLNIVEIIIKECLRCFMCMHLCIQLYITFVKFFIRAVSNNKPKCYYEYLFL